MDAEQLRELTTEELKYMLDDLDKQGFEWRNKKVAQGKLSDTTLLRKMRRQKARILTIMTERVRLKEVG